MITFVSSFFLREQGIRQSDVPVGLEIGNLAIVVDRQAKALVEINL